MKRRIMTLSVTGLVLAAGVLALNSYENRVYQVGLDTGENIVRPQSSQDALASSDPRGLVLVGNVAALPTETSASAGNICPPVPPDEKIIFLLIG